MKNSITQWAQAGDPNAMIKLAEIYIAEGDLDAAKKFLAQAAEKNYRPAAKMLAKILDDEKNFPDAVKFYMKAAESNDVAAMERLIELCPADEKILDAVLKIIDGQFNDIYSTEKFVQRCFAFGSGRNEEYTHQYQQAIERRRIRNKIQQLKAKL